MSKSLPRLVRGLSGFPPSSRFNMTPAERELYKSDSELEELNARNKIFSEGGRKEWLDPLGDAAKFGSNNPSNNPSTPTVDALVKSNCQEKQ